MSKRKGVRVTRSISTPLTPTTSHLQQQKKGKEREIFLSVKLKFLKIVGIQKKNNNKRKKYCDI